MQPLTGPASAHLPSGDLLLLAAKPVGLQKGWHGGSAAPQQSAPPCPGSDTKHSNSGAVHRAGGSAWEGGGMRDWCSKAQCMCWRDFCYCGCPRQTSYRGHRVINLWWTSRIPSPFSADCFTSCSFLPSVVVWQVVRSPLLHQECFPLSSSSSLSLNLTVRPSLSRQGSVRATTARATALPKPGGC